MTIIEALQSGKRFKLPNWDRWYSNGDNNLNYTLTSNQLLSDSWEIEEEKIEITKRQFIRAYNLALVSGFNRTDPVSDQIWDIMKGEGEL